MPTINPFNNQVLDANVLFNGGKFEVGTDVTANAINIGTAGARTITIGSAVSTGNITGTVNINTTGAGVTTIGFGGTGAVIIGNATGNTVINAGNFSVAAGDLDVTGGNISAINNDIVAVLGQIIAGGDTGGTSGKTTFTNATLGTGAGANNIVKPSGATGNKSSDGYLKFYVGSTAVYVPYWTDPS